MQSNQSSESRFSTAEDNEQNKNNVEFEIYGTIQETTEQDEQETGSFVSQILDPTSLTYFESILSCDYVIYDISADTSQVPEARYFLKLLEAQCESLHEKPPTTEKHLILVSSIMTWAQTPMKPDEPIVDTDYRSRRSHPCFKEHMALEREVMNAQKRHKKYLKTVVITPGLIYGDKEDILHYMFKKLYYNKCEIEIFFPGNNFVPIIHIQDFAK